MKSHGNRLFRKREKIYQNRKELDSLRLANSVYATNIMAVLFPIYFGNVCAAAGADNLVLWSYGTSAATFLCAVLAPVLALWPTTRAIRSGCSWPAWCWAWPLPCSPP
mgnify:CR=1 FL=1